LIWLNNYRWLTCGLRSRIFVDESRWGSGGLKAGRGILDLRGGTGGTDLLLAAMIEILLGFCIGLFCFGVESLNEGGVSPFLIDNEDGGWGLLRNDVVGFFNNGGGGGGCFERLIFILLLIIGLDLIWLVNLLLRKVDDGREKSVSSKLNESDFDAIDNELALWRSILKKKRIV
jgi:hypothetical protein